MRAWFCGTVCRVKWIEPRVETWAAWKQQCQECQASQLSIVTTRFHPCSVQSQYRVQLEPEFRCHTRVFRVPGVDSRSRPEAASTRLDFTSRPLYISLPSTSTSVAVPPSNGAPKASRRLVSKADSNCSSVKLPSATNPSTYMRQAGDPGRVTHQRATSPLPSLPRALSDANQAIE